MKRVRYDITVNGSGAGSLEKGIPGGGTLYAIQLIDGNYADGVDVTVTCELEDLSHTIFAKSDWNSDQIAYPRVLQQLATDGTNLTTHCEPLVYGNVKVTVAQGGNATSGSFILYIREI